MKLKTLDIDRPLCVLTEDSLSYQGNNHMLFIILVISCYIAFGYAAINTLNPIYMVGIIALFLLTKNPLQTNISYTLGIGDKLNYSVSIPLVFSRLFIVDGHIFMPENKFSKIVHQNIKIFKNM